MKTLEILEQAYDYIPKSPKFKSTVIITCHHIIEIDYILMNYLEKLGFGMKNIFVIGKNYSSNKKTFDKYIEKGIYVDKSSLKLNTQKSFDEEFQNNIKEFLKYVDNQIKDKDIHKIIIYDDGGFLLSELMTNYNYEFLKKDVIGIEHTSSGYNRIQKLKFQFPVINVAKSFAKLKNESPFIAEDSVIKILNQINKHKANVKNVLIIGGGFIGKSMKEKCEKYFKKVDIFDLKKSKSDFKSLKIYKYLKDYDLIIGTTGNTSININDFKYMKKETILASISSSDREFSAFELRNDNQTDIHADIKYDNIIILNNGFPVNFDGKETIAPLHKIQFTVALVLYSIYQATSKKYQAKRFIQLNKKFQLKISNNFYNL